MNKEQQEKAAALLKETSKFFDARFGAVELDDDTRRKLAAVGMDNAFDDWTKNWKPPSGEPNHRNTNSNVQADLLVETKTNTPVVQGDLDRDFFDSMASSASVSSSFRAGFGPPMPGLHDTTSEVNSSSDVPDYLKIATGTATARRSSALQRGMPRVQPSSGFSESSNSSALPKTEDLKKGFEKLLSKPPPAFDALSVSGGSDARRLRKAQSELRRKSSQGFIETTGTTRNRARGAASTGASKHSGYNGFPSSGPESGSFDYEKLRQAQQYAAQFELSVNEDALTMGVGSNASKSTKRLGKKGGKRGGPKRQTNIRGAYRRQAGKNSGANKSRKKTGKRNGAGSKMSGGAFSEERMLSNHSKNDPSSINVEELTKNFEEGRELQRLRAELAESQASLAGSTNFLTKAKDWFK